MKIEKAIRKSHYYNEDRIVTGEKFCMVIDGATGLQKLGLKPTEASWFASFIKKNLPANSTRIKERLDGISKKAYDEFIAFCQSVSASLNREDIYYPSAGLAWVEDCGDKIKIYTIGDCEVFVKTKSGETYRHVLPELFALDSQALAEIVRVKKQNSISMKEAVKLCQGVLLRNRRLMNKENGYSVFTLSKNPDFRYLYAEYDKADVAELYLYTDGVSQAFDEMKIYASCEEMFAKDVNIHEEIKKIEKRAYADRDCEKYPRFKTIDDISFVKIRF
ncbi:MAG: hypothetical protein E7368_01980 [Clostridiales bacterium]|nr:hypothetical protein [Clostridiales bacterium]